MTTKTFDLIQYIGLSLFGVGAMLLMIHLIGEVHGLIVTVIILFGHTAHLNVRCTSLQRQVNDLRQEQVRAESGTPDQVK